jgi:hypothetical protein
MQNAVGSHALTLAIPMQIQYWNGTTFATNTLDSCTTLARSDIALDFNPPSNLTACETAVNAAGIPVAATNSGRSYLLGRWNDAADPDGNASTMHDDKPSARAAFGLYGGQPSSFIYFRENY